MEGKVKCHIILNLLVKIMGNWIGVSKIGLESFFLSVPQLSEKIGELKPSSEESLGLSELKQMAV